MIVLIIKHNDISNTSRTNDSDNNMTINTIHVRVVL